MIQENLRKVHDRVVSACSAAGRSPEEVKLLLASKSVGADRLRECLAADHHYFGENRVQDLVNKMSELAAEDITWDFIGHLQTNKVKEIVGKVNLIHSVDRSSLVKTLNQRASGSQKILIEINTSGEESKAGVSLSDFPVLLEEVLTSEHLNFCGLMTIATNTSDEKVVRTCFADLFTARVAAASISGLSESALELSMGMSSDFEWAIQEGATIIRLGSLVLGDRT